MNCRFGVIALLILAFTLLTGPAAWCATERALLISSYHPAFPTFFKQINGIKAAFESAKIQLDVEFMDSKRFSEKQDFARFDKSLSAKMPQLPEYDILLTADDNAFNYAMDHRDTLFKGIPMVFFGVNDKTGAMRRLKGRDNTTGVFECISLQGTFDLMKEAVPELREVIAITDSTTSGQVDLRRFMAQRKNTNLLLKVLDLSTHSWNQLRQAVATLGKNQAILLLSAYRDKDGTRKSFAESTDFIVDNAAVPVFHLWEHGIGQGLLGGRVVSHYNQGRLAGELALEILEGQSPSDLQIIEGEKANICMFDDRVLASFDLFLEDRDDALIINKRTPLLEQHRDLINKGGPVIIFLLSAVGCLLYLNRALHKARNRLRESELRYRTSIDSAPDAILMTTSEGRILEANKAAYRLMDMDWKKQRLEGRGIFDLLPQDEWDHAREALVILNEEGVYRGGSIALAIGHANRYVYVDAVRMQDDTDLWFCKDVTEIRKAQNALEESETRFRSLIDQAADAILVLDVQGRITTANRSACFALGYGTEEILSKRITLFIPELEIAEEWDLWPQHPETLEYDIHRRDGSSFPAEIRIGGISFGNKHMLLAIARDVTKRKRNERRILHESAINYAQASIAKGLTQPNMSIKEIATLVLHHSLTITGSDIGYVGTIEPETENLLVHTFRYLQEDEQCGIKNHGAVFPKGENGYSGLWGAALNTLEPVMTNDPSSHPASVGMPHNHVPLRNFASVPVVHQGTLVGQVAVGNAQNDYTVASLEALSAMANLFALALNRKSMDEAMLTAKEQAEAASRAKSEFLANMSHEIRTPLNGMFGMLQLALAKDLPEELRHYLETALESGRNLLGVINDILDFSKIEAGKIELHEEDFALADTVSSVMEIFRETGRQQDIDISWELSPALPSEVHGDAGRVRQILFNLVGNAMKFTESGHVFVECHPLPPRSEDDVRLLIHVEDTGIGIPEARLSDIFEAFEQVDGSHTRRYQGSGLGLPIVRRFARLMNGDALLESTEGEGTSALVCLSLGRAKGVSQDTGDSADTAGKLGNLRILLAEDERVNRLAARKMLEQQGHTVVTARNGTEALNILENDSFDAILMDIQMPEIDGMEVTRRLRRGNIGGHGETPVIALTAHALKGDRKTFMASGMDGYIAKPVQIEDVQQELLRVLSRRNKR